MGVAKGVISADYAAVCCEFGDSCFLCDQVVMEYIASECRAIELSLDLLYSI